MPSPPLPYLLLRHAQLELARLRRIRGAHRRTGRRIQAAQAQLLLAITLLGMPIAGAAGVPQFLDPLVPYGIGPVDGESGLGFADLDGDGDLDALSTTKGHELVFLENTGGTAHPAFAAPVPNPFGVVDVDPGYVTFADLDGDSDRDLVIAGVDIAFYANTGTGGTAAFAPAVADPFGLHAGGQPAPSFTDVDGDGDLDAFVNQGFVSRRMVLFENTGTALAPAFTSPLDPFGLSASAFVPPVFVDLDGDGDLDFFGGDFDHVLFAANVGSALEPAFAPPVADPFGLSPEIGRWALFGDLDGDGDLDLLARPGDALFFENTGSATDPAFAPPLANPFGLFGPSNLAPTGATMGDLDGDGDLDVLFFSFGDVRFFENTGTAGAPAFADAVPSVLPDQSVFLQQLHDWRLLDIDEDGDLDLLAADSSGKTRLVENTGTALLPSFAAPGATVLESPGFYALPPALGDLDGDGDLDALVTSRGDGAFYFENTSGSGLPTIVPPISPFGLRAGAERAGPALADLDGDGNLDAVAGWSYGYFTVFSSRWGATQPPFVGAGVAGPAYPGSPALADLDGDGDEDLFVGMDDGQTLLVENRGTASVPSFFSPLDPFGLVGVQIDNRGVFADIDGDGDLDRFVGTFDRQTLFFENLGNRLVPYFAAPVSQPFGLTQVGDPSLHQPFFPSFGDLDGDGDLDALRTGDLGQAVFFSENTGTAQAPAFAAPVEFPFGIPSVPEATRWELADLDGDGDLDLVSGVGHDVVFLQNTGTTSVPAFAAPATNPFGLSELADDRAVTALADLDRDGDLDLFVGDEHGATTFFENTGARSAPAFGPPVTRPFGIGPIAPAYSYASPSIADIDGDGDLDAFVDTYRGHTVLFENVEKRELCAPTPVESCSSGFEKGKLLVDERDPGKEKFSLQLSKGPALDTASLGDPLSADGARYAICLYRDGNLLAGAFDVARAGESCGKKPCWKPLGEEGFAYADASGEADGVRSLRLRAGAARKAAMSADASHGGGYRAGAAATLGQASSVTVQIATSEGSCLTAVFGEIRHTEGRLKAKLR